MTGKQIAENLRDNREKWTRYRYYEDGKYCVIGLKLMEMGVKVEEWPLDGERGLRQGQMVGLIVPDYDTIDPSGSLTWLQRVNDGSDTVDYLINWADQHAETEFPIEALAKSIQSQAQN